MINNNNKNKSLDEKIDECISNIEIGKTVRFLRDGGEIFKGFVRGISSKGAYVSHPPAHANDHEGRQDDDENSAEWYPYRRFAGGKLNGGLVLG